MIKVVITNKIGEKIDEYIEQYGSTKSWIANQIGIKKQTLYTIIKSKNPTIETLEKLSLVLDCSINELYDKEVIQDGMVVKVHKSSIDVSLK